MADPMSVIALIEGSIGLVLQCGSVAKTLSDMMTKFKNAEVAITSMIQEVETIQFAWNRIKEWSEEHAEAATDSSFVQRLEKSLQCGTLVLSALEQDLANYKQTTDNSSFILRSKMAWNERAFLDHQHRVRGQVQAMTLMLQVSQLSTSKAQTKLLKKKEKALGASDESAYSIVPSTIASRMSVSSRSRTSISSIESKELVYYPLSFEDDLFTARVYKRNYRNAWVNTLSRFHRGKRTEERRIQGAELKAPENKPLLSSSAPGMTARTNMSVHSSQTWRSDQQISLPPGPALTAEAKAKAMDRSVMIADSIPPTSGKGSNIDSDLQNEIIDPTGQFDVVTAVDPASRHIAQRDKKSKVALPRFSPAREMQCDMNLSLFQAVDEGNLDKVKALINLAAQDNPQHVFEQLPIRLAISHHDVSMTKFLIQEGAKCAQEWRGRPPIHIACEFGDHRIMKFLLDVGASASSLDAQQEQPLHTLMSVQHSSLDASDLIELLISRGADVNARTGTNETPLHLSCKNPNVDTIRSLLVHGADPGLVCEGGKTALHVLAEIPRHISHDTFLAVFRLLHDLGADANAKDEIGDTPLHVFAKPSFASVPVRGDAYAIFFEILISHGANMNAQNNAGDTPLHVLVCQPVYYMREWTEIKATMQLLLQHGADINTRNMAGKTPLNTLVTESSNGWNGKKITQLLLQYGADANIQNNAGDTPFHILVCRPGYSVYDWTDIIATIQLLLLHGADFNTRNKAGNTPLYTLVAQHSDGWYDEMINKVVQLLLQCGVNVSTQNNAGDTPLDILARSGYFVENNAVVEKIN